MNAPQPTKVHRTGGFANANHATGASMATVTIHDKAVAFFGVGNGGIFREGIFIFVRPSSKMSHDRGRHTKRLSRDCAGRGRWLWRLVRRFHSFESREGLRRG